MKTVMGNLFRYIKYLLNLYIANGGIILIHRLLDLASVKVYDHLPGTSCQASSQCNGFNTGGAQCMQSICSCINGAASNGATCQQFNSDILLQVIDFISIFANNNYIIGKGTADFRISENFPGKVICWSIIYEAACKHLLFLIFNLGFF